jgi:dolichol kinase
VTGTGLRRAIHAASASVLLIGLSSWTTLRVATMLLAAGALVFELARLRVPAFQQVVAAALPVYRPHEVAHPSGALWLALGYAVAAWFPAPAATAGILAAALADPAASLVGGRWGRGSPKSWAGTGTVLLIVTVAAAVVGVRFPAAVAVGAVGGAVERWSGPLDDNLVIAPAVAAAVALLA